MRWPERRSEPLVDDGAARPSGRGRAARVVRDVRLGLGDLVHDHVVVRPLDGSLDLRRLVAGADDEAIVLRADTLVHVERHPHALPAAVLHAALAQELERPVGCPCLCLLAERSDPLVDLAEEGLVARLSREPFFECHAGRSNRPAAMRIFRPVTSDDVLELLDPLDVAGIEWWVDGGWGVDALLGYETRPHDDLDLAVPAHAIARLGEVLPEFGHVQEHQLPAAYVLEDERGRQLDLHPLDLDDDGNGWQPQPNGPPALWPRGALTGHGTIAGRGVRCTSPEFQVEAHLYAGYDDVDWSAIVSLCERFDLPLPEGGPPGFVHERRTVRVAPATEAQLREIVVGDLQVMRNPVVL